MKGSTVIRPASLSATLDALAALTFEGKELPSAERAQVAQWIAARQGLPGAYADTFAGFPEELARGIVVFTGERITSASARHILGEEASRTLRSLRVREPNVRAALERANAGMLSCLERAALDPRNGNPGKFCCGKCTIGLWRNLLAGGLDRQEERLRKGIGGVLKAQRASEGKWRVFPFWYTVLALSELARSEMDIPEARQELKFVAATLERTAKRSAPSSVYAQRRQELARRALAAM